MAGLAIPNLYFHATLAYAILGHNGVEPRRKNFTGEPPIATEAPRPGCASTAHPLTCVSTYINGALMEFLGGLGLLALGSRLRALSEQLYLVADEIYQRRDLALEGRWFPLLRLLHDRGPQTVGEIAQAIGQTHSAVSQLADKLVRGGWLATAADPQDQRRRVVQLTARAQAELRRAKRAWKAIEGELDARCRAAGIDPLATLAALEQIVAPGLAQAIGERCARDERAAVRIVPFSSALREHFYRLNAAWLSKYFYLEEIDHRVLSHPEREVIEPGGAVFFALIGDEVVGTCALKREAPGVLELTKMAVDERYQGLGLGRRLIEAAIAGFQRRRGKRLFLETHSKMVPAMRLYESVGFEQQAGPKPDSHYQRSDVYMIWRQPARTARGRRPAKAAKRSAGRRAAARS